MWEGYGGGGHDEVEECRGLAEDKNKACVGVSTRLY
jgi:hypothetical protein